MKALLDTHVLLWWITDDSRLSATARQVIEHGANAVYISVASVWEVTIKAQIGRLDLPRDPEGFFDQQITENRFDLLTISLAHAVGVYHLPMNHRDPFDRLLISQARSESLPIVTADEAFSDYNVELIW